jgi:hypothetical protein
MLLFKLTGAIFAHEVMRQKHSKGIYGKIHDVEPDIAVVKRTGTIHAPRVPGKAASGGLSFLTATDQS